ncbi:UNVERIFIED_CONTAM: hypothetical protein PYX00_009709 [Menopon gallinae]|uniref:Intraflagellar transport protein 43 homolog n=1 Tax=Menopon gallinae TaxID=328185 RepID=A0AAW2HCE1_9NEOP
MMDDKLDFDGKTKKSAPKKGRRAGLGFFTLSGRESGNQSEAGGTKEFLSPRLKENNSGGWADESLKPSSEQLSSADKDFDDGIPVIPNLEDNADDEFIDKIAKAPLIGVNRVVSYKELENDLLKHTAFANLEEVNLRILTNHLYPESALVEPDEPWTKDSLLSEVISAMNDEREKETVTSPEVSFG